jgi:hypothetical protein
MNKKYQLNQFWKKTVFTDIKFKTKLVELIGV